MLFDSQIDYYFQYYQSFSFNSYTQNFKFDYNMFFFHSNQLKSKQQSIFNKTRKSSIFSRVDTSNINSIEISQKKYNKLINHIKKYKKIIIDIVVVSMKLIRHLQNKKIKKKAIKSELTLLTEIIKNHNRVVMKYDEIEKKLKKNCRSYWINSWMTSKWIKMIVSWSETWCLLLCEINYDHSFYLASQLDSILRIARALVLWYESKRQKQSN